MRTPTTRRVATVLAVGAAALAGCAALSSSDRELDAKVDAMMKASFRDQGIATVDRLAQDPANEACSEALGQPVPEKVARRIEAESLKTVKPPSDGRYLGDWRRGEALAQNGRGMTWTDPSADPSSNGGNCYNCHELARSEISYGTIGPSLNQYGKLRGVSDPASPSARAMVEYTWGKLWNARAYNACSNMPRFGHAGLLSEQQLKDLMALLLDPQSPVNR